MDMRGLNSLPTAEDDSTLDNVLKFANIAGPGVGDEALHRCQGHFTLGPAIAATHAVGKKPGQERNVLCSCS